jgi:hypothetical protein
LLILAVTAAWAAYLESGGGRSDERVAPPPPERRLPPPDDAAPVRRLVQAVEIGAPFHTRGLTVFPLTLRDTWNSGLATLDEALRAGWLRVIEKTDATVSELVVENESRRGVLLVSGEILAGGRQNRMVRYDVLVPARSGPVTVPVYCGEKERWAGDTREFKAAGAAAQPGLRRDAAMGRAQSEIWEGIETQLKRAGAETRSRDYAQVYREPEVGRHVDSVTAECRRWFRGRTVGFVVLHRSRILGAECFEDPETFDALWPKLIRGYAVEVYGDWAEEKAYPSGGGNRDVRRFLEDVLEARIVEQHTPGAGRCYSVSGAATGSALVWDGRVAHLALFGESPVRPAPPPPHPHPPVPLPRILE